MQHSGSTASAMMDCAAHQTDLMRTKTNIAAYCRKMDDSRREQLEEILRAREVRLSEASHAGFFHGIASALAFFGANRPAPPTVRRGLGSLCDDARALQDDGRRLFNGARS